jgi:hypothetical protein
MLEFIDVAAVVLELELFEDLLQLMRRSRRTTYEMRIVVIVHGSDCACASLRQTFDLVEKQLSDELGFILDFCRSIDMTK